MDAKTNCPCGNCGDHVVASRRTADGVRVEFWSGGDVSTRWELLTTGLSREAANLVAGEIEVYDLSEVRALCCTARRAIEIVTVMPLEYLRKSMAGWKLRTVKQGQGRAPVWVREEAP